MRNLSAFPIAGFAAGVCKRNDLDFLALDAVDDPVWVSLDELAPIAFSHVFPELGEGFDFFTGFLELVEEVGGDVSGSLLVKGDRFEDFQFGLEDVAHGHPCRIFSILASSSSELEALLSPASKRATRASYSVISSGLSSSS